MKEESTQPIKHEHLADEQELLTVREAYQRLRISKWKLYDLIRRNLLETIQIGRRRLVPATAVTSMLRRLKRGFIG